MGAEANSFHFVMDVVQTSPPFFFFEWERRVSIKAPAVSEVWV